MKNQNLFIVENNPMESNRLVNFLEKRFGNTLTISTFNDGESALKNVNSNTTIVILDYDLKGERGDVLLKEIKKINALTEVIILSSAEDIATAIDAFRKGAKNYVIKGESATRILYSMIFKIINYPVKILVERFAVNKILAIFLTYFIFIGILVYLGMQLLP
ncbi:response regulator [Flavobacterium sp.]|uniref:response regulator n=1 Tax=Flavobacterium sp. TaxID=239 RepID=UPI00262973DF|nr:response regulator [Flavobacterium sp.]